MVDGTESLRRFTFERVLNHDPATHTVTLLGTFPASDGPPSTATAIVRVERAALSVDDPEILLRDGLADIRPIGSTDIYSWMHAWLVPSSPRPDLKLNIICPATDVHIRKYSAQRYVMVHETPDIYARIVRPYIAAFPASRTKWVHGILGGSLEADSVFHRDSDPIYGYVLLPDMKWDLTTLSSLYLLAIAASPSIRSMRDLTKAHIPMLRSIRREARRVVREKWGIEDGGLRMFVHYQPGYYHFHVHIVNVEYQGLLGMSVGQAHLLDDVISLVRIMSLFFATLLSVVPDLIAMRLTQLELSPDDGPSIFARMTLTYSLGDQHGLYEAMKAAQGEVAD